ncbi:MAG TPA: FixH family protein [Blastocatellia bacterium]|nr:FixH family protein [Blastocatellia bacterium]
MKLITIFVIVTTILITAACGRKASDGGKMADAGKTIKSAQAGSLTVTLSSSTGELKNGDNDLMLTFADASGKSVDVGAASLNFHMPAMGAMAVMNDQAALTTTNTPGMYHAKVTLEVGGTWEAQVKYQGQQGTGQTSMTVTAK